MVITSHKSASMHMQDSLQSTGHHHDISTLGIVVNNTSWSILQQNLWHVSCISTRNSTVLTLKMVDWDQPLQPPLFIGQSEPTSWLWRAQPRALLQNWPPPSWPFPLGQPSAFPSLLHQSYRSQDLNNARKIVSGPSRLRSLSATTV